MCAAGADPCTIAGTRDVASGCTLDFGTRAVVLTGALQSATPSGSFTVRAGTLTLSAGKIRSVGPAGLPGGNVTVQVTGALVLTGSGPTLDVGGSAGGGILSVTAGSIDVRAGTVEADGTGSEACGGVITLRATSGPLLLSAPVHATGNLLCAGGLLDVSGDDVTIATTLNVAGGDYPGGITVTANVGDVVVTGNGALKANGEQIEIGDGGDGGPIALLAESGKVSIAGPLNTEGASPEGEAGSIVVVAGGDVTVSALLSAQGNGGGSNGGSIEIDAGGNLSIAGNVRTNGGSDAAAGEIDLRSDGIITVAAGKLVQANGGSFGGGAITLRDATRIDVAGTLEARGSTGNGGFTTLEACRVNVTGTLDTGAGAGGMSGANAITAGLATVGSSGRLLATPCNPTIGTCNVITLMAGVPGLDPLAVTTPAPSVVLDPTNAICCGNGGLEPGETCDDGNDSGCDGCSHLCQLEPTPACPSDGNECTADCSPIAGCTYKPRTGQTCGDDGDACTRDVCSASAACTHPARVCNDGVSCTVDACLPNVGCVATPDDARCNDAESCTHDTCSGAGCVHDPAPDDTACSDGDECTTEDACTGGVCTPHGPPLRCDDGNACTTDTCMAAIGCHAKEEPALCPCGSDAGPAPSGTVCADGNDCSQGDRCDGAGGCVAGPVCPEDGDACTSDVCLPLMGGSELCVALDNLCTSDCSAASDGTPCSDASACTTGTCQSGTCVATPVPCGDGDRCTGVDYCLAVIGCRSSAPPLGDPMCEAPPSTLDAFLCYAAKTDRTGPRFEPVFGVPVGDRFGSARADVRKHDGLCLPVDVAGSDPTAPSHPDKLGGYLVRLHGAVPSGAARSDVEVQSALGRVRVDLKKIDGALVPAALDTTTPPGPPVPPDPDHFSCYKVATTPNTNKFVPVFGLSLVDQLGSLTVDVARPTRLCTPLDVDGQDPGAASHAAQLLCFQVRTSSGTPRFVKRSGIFLGSELGAEKVNVTGVEELCLPASIVP